MRHSAFRTAVLYATLAGLWILAFDLLSDLLPLDWQRFAGLHLALAVSTVLLLYLLLSRGLRAREAAEQALRRAHAALEVRVQERTAALTKANQQLQAEIAERVQAEKEREHLLAQVEDGKRHAQELANTLETERDMLETIMENTHAQLAYLDPQFNFVRVNAAYVQGCGHSQQELLAHNHFELFPNPENQAIFEQVRDTGQPVHFHAKPFEFADQPERGITYWDWTLVPLKNGVGQVQGLLLSLTDVTQSKQAEEALRLALQEARQRQAEIAALLEGSRAVLAYREFGSAARAIFDSCKDLIGATAGYVALLTEDGTENEVLFLEAGGAACSVDPTLPMPIRGLREEAYRTGATVYENDFAGSEWIGFLPPGHARLDNVLFAPMVVNGVAVGLLGLANKPGGFTQNDVRIASAFSELAAIALFNSRTLESLQNSEERFRSVAQTAGEGIITVDSRGKIVFWNKAATTIFGYAYDEAIGQPLTFVIPEWLHVAHQDGEGRAASSAKPLMPGTSAEMVGLARDGREFPLEVSLSTWTIREECFFTSIIKDITERAQAEEALQKERDFISAILDTAGALVVVLDPQGRIVRFNRACERMTGYSFREVHGKCFWDFFLIPEEVEPVKAVFEKLRAGNFPDEHENFWMTRDGRRQLIAWSNTALLDNWGSVEYIVGTGINITARKQAEEALRARTHELSTLLEISRHVALTLELEPLLDLILDQLKAVVDYESATIYRLEGDVLTPLAQRGPIPHEKLLSRFPFKDSDIGRQMVLGQKPVIIPDVWGDTLLARDFREVVGEPSRSCSWMGVPLMIKDRTMGILALQHSQPGHYHTPGQVDLSLAFANQAAVAIENTQLYEQAQALAAMEERQRLARDLHDAVSQTLFSASLSAEVLPRLWERDPVEGRRCLDEVHHLTRSALAEMRTLLLELRPEALIETGLSDLLSQLVEAVGRRARLPVTLAVEELSPVPPDVQVALYRISQEALNNVAKHAEASRVAVRLRYAPPSAAASEGGQKNRLELRISDDGRGFDPQCVPPDSLGLSIMHERAEAIGAELEIKSQIGHGTQVVVVWPGAQGKDRQ